MKKKEQKRGAVLVFLAVPSGTGTSTRSKIGLAFFSQ